MLTPPAAGSLPATAAAARPVRPERPNPEVPAIPVRPAQAQRRQFTAAYKLRILHEADHCAIGHLGALLRREGLYSSHLAKWRGQRARGSLAALAPQQRGRPAPSRDAGELARLRQENERLAQQLAAAETVIEIQKKVSVLLGLTRSERPVAPRPTGGRRRS